jgi:heme/copper-type cytochrome/quinol oxidase subunit 1
MISLIIPVFSRRPLIGYPFIAIATVLTGVVGFGVWLHHMFTVGMSDIAMSFFSAGSMTISVFTTIQVFAWVATVWRGHPVSTASMHFVLGSIVLLVVGGLSGVFTGVIPVDWQVHNTYYVAHIHYVRIGANVFPVFVAFYYWLPKMTGSRMRACSAPQYCLQSPKAPMNTPPGRMRSGNREPSQPRRTPSPDSRSSSLDRARCATRCAAQSPADALRRT